MLNHITIMGRLTKDPELRRTGTGDDGKKEADFIDCVAWRQTGEFVSKYFKKGSVAVVSGRLQIRGWTDKEGNKRRAAEVVAENVYFGDSKKNDGNDNAGGYNAPGSYGSQPASDFGTIDEDDAQLPF